MNRKVLIYKINYNSSLIQYGAGKKVNFIEFKLDDPKNKKTKRITLESESDVYKLNYIKNKFFFLFYNTYKTKK